MIVALGIATMGRKTTWASGRSHGERHRGGRTTWRANAARVRLQPAAGSTFWMRQSAARGGGEKYAGSGVNQRRQVHKRRNVLITSPTKKSPRWPES